MDDLLRIMEEVRPDVDFKTEKSLIDGKILDSFDIISIVSEANDHFGIEINVNNLTPENFNSAEALYELITQLQKS